jgi:predicted porin
MDWGFVTYSPSEHVSVHAGVLKFPNLLFSETFDVGLLNPWARLPQEIYNLDGGGSNLLFETFEGTQVTLTRTVGDTDLQFDSYFGETEIENGHFKDLTGYVVTLSRNTTVLKASFNSGEMHIEEVHEVPLMEAQTRAAWTVSAKTEWNNLALWAEYGSSKFDGLGSLVETGPYDIDLSELDTDAWYVAAAYQMGRFRPVITIGNQEQDSGSGQESISLGLNYTMGAKAVVKVEWTRVDPTRRSATSALAMAGLDEQAGMFMDGLQESHANIITLSMNLIF